MKPLKRRELNGQPTSMLNMKLPQNLHGEIRRMAFEEGKTVSLLITEILEIFLKQRKGKSDDNQSFGRPRD